MAGRCLTSLAALLLCWPCLGAERMGLELLEGRLRLGGQFYLRGEARSNYYTRDGGLVSDDALSSRLRLSLEARPTPGVRFRLTLIDTHDWDEPHPYLFPYTYDHPFDVQQCYLELEIPGTPLAVWGGRREVVRLGSRLIGTSIGWTNKTITYDGVGLKVSWGRTDLEWFLLDKVIPERRNEAASFDDDWFDGTPANLYGLWLTHRGRCLRLELFGLFDDRRDGDDIYTAGWRLRGGQGRLDWDHALAYQWGHRDGLDRRAWATYLEAGWRLREGWRAALQYNFASGDDDPHDGRHETFDQMYGAVHGRYGLMDFFSWQNMHDLYAYLQGKPSPALRVTLGLHGFWLAESEDVWYSCYRKAQRHDPSGRASRHVGEELDLLVVWRLPRGFYLKAFGGHFFAGPYVEDTGRAPDADYGYLEVGFEF